MTPLNELPELRGLPQPALPVLPPPCLAGLVLGLYLQKAELAQREGQHHEHSLTYLRRQTFARS